MKRITTEEFIQRARKVHGDEYIYNEKTIYKTSRDLICITCRIHGEFWQKANGHLNGKGCNKCHGTHMKTYDEFVTEARQVHGDRYIYTNSEYKGANIKIKIVCPIHGEFWQNPSSHIMLRQGCPKCNQSKLEISVENFLKENGVEYITQHKFDWLKYKRNLLLDFYLPQYNVAIECQGEQHFITKDFYGGKVSLETTQMRDSIKRKLCEENGVKLLYYSNLHIKYPYHVYEDLKELLKEIK